MAWVRSGFPQFHLLFIALQLLVTPSMPPPNTRRKNKSAHPGTPDMTSSQLASAGLSRTVKTPLPSKKKLTKDQQIAALRDELRAAQDLISTVSPL